MFHCTSDVRTRPEVLQCLSCQHVFSNPLHWPSNLQSEYEEVQDPEYLLLASVKQKTFERAARKFMEFVAAPASVLEVGSYTGLFLSILKENDFDTVGIEPSRWGSSIAKDLGVKVFQGSAEQILREIELPLFDSVVSWDVLEHVEDPALFVSLLASRAKPGGFVFLSTLDRTNWFAKIMGRRWPWVIPMHLHYFDQKSVWNLGRKVGLEPVETYPHVHYAQVTYALARFFGHGRNLNPDRRTTFLDKIVIPVGLGDVRTFVFVKT